MNRLCFALVLPLVWAAAPAAAQMDVEDENYWVDGTSRDDRVRDRGGPSSLDEARGTGRGVTLGSHIGPMPDVYTVRRGDTLWDISGRYFRNPWTWPRLWSFNPEITNPHWIYPLDTLRLVPDGQVSAELPSSGVSIAASRRPESGSVFLRDQGYLDEDALEASGVVVGSPEEHMLLSTSDELYVRFDSDEGVRPGMELTVFRQMGSDERNPEESGALVRVFGVVRLRSYDPERRIGRAVITEALDPIERGYRIANIPRRFEMVPPVANDRDLNGRVVATLRPRELLGDFQVVFVNVGEEQGVRAGNRLFVIRAGDEWRESLDASEQAFGATVPGSDEPDEYPEEIVAEGRVVNVRPNSAALMVTRSTTEVHVGDRAEMRQGY